MKSVLEADMLSLAAKVSVLHKIITEYEGYSPIITKNSTIGIGLE